MPRDTNLAALDRLEDVLSSLVSLHGLLDDAVVRFGIVDNRSALGVMLCRTMRDALRTDVVVLQRCLEVLDPSVWDGTNRVFGDPLRDREA